MHTDIEMGLLMVKLQIVMFYLTVAVEQLLLLFVTKLFGLKGL